MKILFIANSVNEKAGTERVVCSLANAFVENLNYSVTIVNRTVSEIKDVAYSLNKNVTLVCLKGNYLAFYCKLNLFLWKNKFDFVIAHNMGRISVFCSLLFKRNKDFFISYEHASYISYPKWVKVISKLLYCRFDQIVTLTKSDQLYYQKFHSNVVKINNISAYYTDNNLTYNIGSKTIIAIGRLTYEKNFQALLSAWKIIEQQKKDWKLEIYGKGNDKLELEQFIIENNLQSAFLKGAKEDLFPVYSNASFLVMSSRYEGFGLVLVEAQAFGLPLVSFDCPYGPAEIIAHNKNGLLVENGNIQELAKAILDLMNSPDKRIKFSVHAKKSSENYTIDNILTKWKKNVFNIKRNKYE